MKDLDGRYLMANQRCGLVLGRTTQQVIGKTDYEILPRAVADRLSSHMRTVVQGGKSVTVEEIVPCKGKGRTYLANLYPLRDEKGMITATAGIFTDITRQKLAQRRARRAVRQRDQFLAMLSHELRNPLAAIASASELMRGLDVNHSEAKEVCNVITRQSRQTARLLDDLLDVSRVAEGKIELRKAVFDLRETVDAAVEAARSTLTRHQHELKVSVEDCPVWVEGDAARLQQIQVNLLVNAAKYTPDGGRISLELHSKDHKAFISVTDTGVGMTAEFQKRVFEPFVQSKRSLDRCEGGIGLGLTLVRSLIELHEGEVDVHSDGRGKGSHFTVWLPLTTKRPEIAPPRESAPAASTPLRVLIVEDNSDVRDMTMRILQLEGYDVGTAADGLAGLNTIMKDLPDVALIDIGLPELDGYEVARRVRENQLDICLVALTGYGQKEDRRRSRAAGFDDHLTKPVNLDHLKSLLAKVGQRDRSN